MSHVHAFFLFVSILIFAFFYDSVQTKLVYKLGKYENLTYTSRIKDNAGKELIEQVVAETKFAPGIKKEIDVIYEKTMAYYTEEAAYFSLTVKEYANRYYSISEEQLRIDAKAAAEESMKQKAVLEAIAQKENITIGEYDFKENLPIYMEAYGYTDEELFLKSYPEEDIRAEMLYDRVLDYIYSKATRTE